MVAAGRPNLHYLALLLDYTDDEEVALAEYKAFKTEVVSQLEFRTRRLLATHRPRDRCSPS